MKITKIAPAVKTAGRYNVFVDEKFAFSLDEAQLVKAGLRKGTTLPQNRLEELKTESDFGKNYIRAVDLVSRRLRSEKEIRDYAFRKQWTKENVERVVARLHERGYLDDAKFAAAFVRSRAATRNFSVKKMRLELRKKGIAPDIIEQTLADSEDFDEMAALRQLVAKKRAHYADDERKLIAYLARQGFSYDAIKSALTHEN
jgi:regulatory protein